METDESVKLGRKRHNAGDLAGAEIVYRQILEETPEHAEALHLLGALVGQRGDGKAAIEFIRRSLEIAPNEVEAIRNLAILLAQAGQLNEAMELLGKAAELNPGDAKTHHDLGKIFAIQNKWNESLAACRRAAELRPESAEVHRDIGAILVRKNQFVEGIAAYLKAIQLRPDLAEGHYGLGQAYQGARRLEEAVKAFIEAARIKSDFVEALASAATVLCELDRFDEAMICHARAVKIKPEAAIVSEALGSILLRKNDVEAAIGQFRRAVAADPNLITGWNLLGLALQYQGRFDESTACFERILSINPEMVEARKNLVNTRRRASEAEIGPLMNRLAEGNLSPQDRIAAEFALGTAMDDGGRFDEAFAHFVEGNKLVKQQGALIGERYDAAEFHGRVDRIIRTFTPELFEQRRGGGDDSEVPVFIVGMPRSGTTLAHQIAASHPQVHGAGELQDMTTLSRKLGEAGGAAWSTEALKQLAAKYIERLRKMSPTALRVVDKMPRNLHFLGLIAVLFPRARVVLCRRDARDTCLSCYFQAFTVGNTYSFDLADCGHYHRENDRLVENWRRVLPLRMLELRYEEVVADLEGQSRRLIDFLGLPWDPKCLEFHRAKASVLTVSVWQVRQPIYQSSVGRWKHYEKHLGPLFTALGQ